MLRSDFFLKIGIFFKSLNHQRKNIILSTVIANQRRAFVCQREAVLIIVHGYYKKIAMLLRHTRTRNEVH